MLHVLLGVLLQDAELKGLLAMLAGYAGGATGGVGSSGVYLWMDYSICLLHHLPAN